jgi:hypothetical protein
LYLAYFVLIVSIVSASILEIAGAKFSAQFGMVTAAAGLLAASNSAGKADRDHLLRALGWVRWALIAVPLFVAAQLIPMWLPLAHPIWTSARDALPGFAFGYVTADFGQTLAAFFLSLAAISLLCVTIIVARNRGRAELVLFVLSAVTTLAALRLDMPRAWSGPANAGSLSLASTFGGLGLTLNLAIMQLAAERAETRHALSRSIAIGLCGLAGALINGTAIFGFSSANSAVAAAFGVVLFLLILIVRRLDLSALAATALSVATLIGAAIVLTFLFEKGSGTALLRLVPDLSAETRAAVERMLADTRWFGAGAGAFMSVARIYQSDAGEPFTAPSAAAAFFVDTGWIGLLATITAVAALLVRLISGALKRGRDSFFPAAAAACLCYSAVEAFASPGLLRPAAIFCLAVIVGLGLAQSVSQSKR